MDLMQYKEVISREHIDGEILCDLDEQSLESDLGVAVKLHRVRLMKVITGCHSAEQFLTKNTRSWQILNLIKASYFGYIVHLHKYLYEKYSCLYSCYHCAFLVLYLSYNSSILQVSAAASIDAVRYGTDYIV